MCGVSQSVMFYVHNIRMKTDDWLYGVYRHSVNGKQNAIGTSRVKAGVS